MGDWAAHIFREHNKKADLCARKGVQGREEERTDTAEVVLPEVTGLCGCGAGSCERGVCGAGILIVTCRVARLISQTQLWLAGGCRD